MSLRAPMLRPRGFTLLEVLIASVIAAAFLSGLFAAFSQVLRASDRAEIVMTAVANGRSGLDAMAVEIKQVNAFAGNFFFRCVDNFAPLVDAAGARYGDGIDQDGDGQADEEIADALDNDLDWTAADDVHAEIVPGLFERPEFVGEPDLGDTRVDEDVMFDGDAITFALRNGDEMVYQLGQFEGRDHVLIRRLRRAVPIVIDPSGFIDEEAPLAEGVMSFNVLAYQPNAAQPRRYWRTGWRSEGLEAISLPPFLPMPSTVLLTLQMYADQKPIETYIPGEPIQVEIISTVVAIEQIINDSRYPRP
jgi:prepilin-type N-terminal cleavage/methylation domain-containing protein